MKNILEKMGKLKENGKKIIGAFPLYPPLELFHSMDLNPIVLWGLKKYFPKVGESDKHIQSYSCSIARHLAEFVLSDAGASMDGLYIYNACDTLRNMPEILTSGLNDAGRKLPLFRMHIPMTCPEQTDTRQYLRNEVSAMIREIEGCFDVSFSGEKFKKSVELYREQRRLAMEAEKRVSQGKMRFVDYLEVSEANLFLPVEEQINALETLLQSKTRSDEMESRCNIVLSGIIPPHASIIETIETAGMRIVANDIASLYRSIAYTPEPTDSAEDYYGDFYYQHFPCSTLLYSGEKRVQALTGMLRDSGAQGMVFIGEKFCEHEYFEFPFLEKQFKKLDVRTLLLEFSIEDRDNIGAYKTRIEAFSELFGS